MLEALINLTAITGVTTAILIVLIILCPLLGAVFGALGGLVVGRLFRGSMTRVLVALKLDVKLWELGAFVGFLGGVVAPFLAAS